MHVQASSSVMTCASKMKDSLLTWWCVALFVTCFDGLIVLDDISFY